MVLTQVAASAAVVPAGWPGGYGRVPAEAVAVALANHRDRVVAGFQCDVVRSGVKGVLERSQRGRKSWRAADHLMEIRRCVAAVLEAHGPGLVGLRSAGKLEGLGPVGGIGLAQYAGLAVTRRCGLIRLAQDGDGVVARLEGDVARVGVDQILHHGDGGGKSRR